MSSSDAVPASALAGVRVLDLSHGVTGPFAARLLGDFGADVVKVEEPGVGDFGRRLNPLDPSAPVPEQSLLFQYLNWNKRGIELDLRNPRNHSSLRELVQDTDIIIEAFRPGTLDGWGLGVEVLLRWNPRLVVVSISNFGQHGPYAGWEASDLVFQAISGIMQISGRADRAPLKHGLNQSLLAAGINAAYAALAAYLAAKTDGHGEHVDLSIHECLVSEMVMNVPFYSFAGAIQGRRAVVQDPFQGEPLPTGSGFVSVQNGGGAPFESFADFFGRAEFREPRLATGFGRGQHAAEVRVMLEDFFAGKDPLVVFKKAAEQRLLLGVVQGAQDFLDCEQLAARKALVTVDHPDTGPHRFPAELAKLSGTPTRIGRRSPRLGEHTGEVLDSLSDRQGRIGPSMDGSADTSRPGPTLPLAGVRVVDLSYVFAVPYMGGLLADLGAEVIRVEAPHRLDQSRQLFGPYLDNDPGDKPYNRTGTFYTLNRGKRSLVLDIKQPAGRRVIRQLIAQSDLVLDNFTPRVMKGWNLTFEDIAKLNPGAIMLSNTAFGSTGPWSAYPGQGTTLEATMGISRYTGYQDDKPWKVGQSYPDFIACWAGLLAIMAALAHRRRTGTGQWIDLGMYQLGPVMTAEALMQLQLDGTDLPRIGNADRAAAPSNLYRADGTDNWIAISVENEENWRALRSVVADERLDDPRFDTLAGRLHHRDELDTIIEAWTSGQNSWTITRTLQSVGVAAGPVVNSRDLLLDPHLRARGFFEWVEHPDPVGTRPIIGRPFRFRNRELRIPRGAPTFGDSNHHVLAEILGLTPDEIDELYAEHVVTNDPLIKVTEPASDFADMLKKGILREVDPNFETVLLDARHQQMASD